MTDKEKLSIALKAMDKMEEVTVILHKVLMELKDVKVSNSKAETIQNLAVDASLQIGEYKALRDLIK